MFAFLHPQAPGGPEFVHELWDEDPKLPAGANVVDVSKWPGIALGWAQRADGSFGPFVPALDDAKAERARILRFSCFHAIVGGFASSALGATHTYASSDTDQTNLDRAALAAITGGDAWTAQIPCTTATGDTAFVAHDAKQVHQVVSDLHATIEGARTRYDALKRALAAAATVEAVQAIVWA